MSLTDRAQKDNQIITSKDWGVPATLTDLAGEVAEVSVIHTKHNTAYDPEGVTMNVRTASVAVSNVKVLEANENYSFKDTDGEITYMNHSISLPDSSGIVKNYIISENYPDEKLGMTVLILGDK